jgi:23S rRNA (cytidine1920-2'-O)/16S rRNA (cytidine1409-2'-O)-methyltransferase
VTNLERLNARHLQPGELPRPDYDVVVMDLSFISLRSVLPAVWPFLAPGGVLVALVKPQFEAGREEATKGRGVIRDEAVRQRALGEVREFAAKELPRCRDRGVIDSPISGADGNREFLLVLEKG